MRNKQDLENWFNFASFVMGMCVGLVLLGTNLNSYTASSVGIYGIIAMGYVVMEARGIR